MNIVLQRHDHPSQVKTRPQIRRHNRTNIIRPPKYPVPDARHEIINKIQQPSRNHAQHRRQHRPSAAQPPQYMQKSVRPHQECAIAGQHHNAIRQPHAPPRRNPHRESLSLQRRKPKRSPAAIMPQHELHRAMAQPATSIVKEIFRALRFLPQEKSIARTSRKAVLRAANRDYGNVSPFPLATVSETL
jgi:hypothetical protein